MLLNDGDVCCWIMQEMVMYVGEMQCMLVKCNACGCIYYIYENAVLVSYTKEIVCGYTKWWCIVEWYMNGDIWW